MGVARMELIGPAFRLNQTTAEGQHLPVLVPLGAGGFVAAWTSVRNSTDETLGIFAQRYDGSGNRVGGELRLDSDAVAPARDFLDLQLVSLSDGGFVALWKTVFVAGGGLDTSTFLRRFDAS